MREDTGKIELVLSDEDVKKQAKKKLGVYRRIISEIFSRGYVAGESGFTFDREDIPRVCDDLGIKTPKNLGDVIYTYRYRQALPPEIRSTEPDGEEWLIKSGGVSGGTKYKFSLAPKVILQPDTSRIIAKLPDATPEIIRQRRLTDEQALLAVVRYNRLIDIFLGITAYSLQNHVRTQVEDIGQIEVDELYVGVDRHGAQYIIPMQAKRGKDRLAVIQTLQDIAFCRVKYGDLKCRAVSAQFMKGDVIAMFELIEVDEEVKKIREEHYQLVPHDQISAEDLQTYRHISDAHAHAT